MSLRESFRLLVKPVHVILELFDVHAPYPSAPDLDGRQLARPHQGVHLRNADAEIDRNVLIALMTSALVVAIWGVARDRLVDIVSSALSTVCGNIGC